MLHRKTRLYCATQHNPLLQCLSWGTSFRTQCHANTYVGACTYPCASSVGSSAWGVSCWVLSVCGFWLVGISVDVCFGVFLLFDGFLFVFPLLQMPFLGCCKAQAGKTAIQMESGGWPGDAMALTSNCTFLGKHTTKNFL